MDYFEQELRRVIGGAAFKSARPQFIGRACFIALSGERRAKVEFVTCGVADNYEALRVTVLNAREGKIDELLLRFKDYFAPKKVGTSDSRVPYIWVYQGMPSWYKQPSSSEIESLGKAVHDYIMLFA